MSIRIMSWVWENSIQKGNELLLLLALADSANDQGVCWPSLETLAKKTRMSRRYVKRVMADLKETGLVISNPRLDDKGDPTSNLYQIIIPTGVGTPRPLPPEGGGLQAPTGGGLQAPGVGVYRPPKPSVNRNSESKNALSKKSKKAPKNQPTEIILSATPLSGLESETPSPQTLPPPPPPLDPTHPLLDGLPWPTRTDGTPWPVDPADADLPILPKFAELSEDEIMDHSRNFIYRYRAWVMMQRGQARNQKKIEAGIITLESVGLADIPEDLKPLAEAFIQYMGRRRPKDDSEKGFWIKAWWDQKRMGLTPEDIRQAFLANDNSRSRFTPTSPASMTNMAWDLKQHPPKKDGRKQRSAGWGY
jgi:hypothetical protein